MERGGQQLYIVTIGDGRSYDLHRIKDPRSSRVQSSLPRPLFRMCKPQFPDFMSFAAINSRIFMVGGWAENRRRKFVNSKRVFIFDVTTSTWEYGPSMNVGKNSPYLIILGGKLFALSKELSFRGIGENMEGYPRFEMLDTNDLRRGWTALQLPCTLDASKEVDGQFSWAATGDFIFASVGNSGTWVFDVNNLRWTQVGEDKLPFSGCAVTVPNVPGVCYGSSIRSGRFRAFRFHLGHNGLVIDKFRIDDSHNFPSLSPSLQRCQFCLPVFCNDGRVYFVNGGVDEAETYSSPSGNQYVQVYAHSLNQRQILKRCNLMRSDDHSVVKDPKLTALWSGSFCGGPSFDPYIQVEAAFAI